MSVVRYCGKCGAGLTIVNDLESSTVTQTPNEAEGSSDRRSQTSQTLFPNVLDSFIVLSSDPTTRVAVNSYCEKQGSSQVSESLPATFEQIGQVIDRAYSNGGEIDQAPLCLECLDSIILEINRRISEAEEDAHLYEAACKELESFNKNASIHTHIYTETERHDMVQLEKMDRQQVCMENELDQLDKTHAALVEEKAKLQSDVAQIDSMEAKYGAEFLRYQWDLAQHEEECAAVNASIQYVTQQLSRLKTTNVMNDTFHIGEDGPFGTINGFRLGRMAPHKVSWDEINAAWGQVCLLMDIITTKGNFHLSQYRIIPRGSFSVVIRKQDQAQLELSGSEGGISIFFTGRRFDQAMVAFLACVRDVYSQIVKQDPQFRIPYPIVEDKVGSLSVKLQFNQDERWTKALKFLLIDIKWILEYVEGHCPG